MKRKYIKPVTTVLMVETQNNYCAATSNHTWVVGKFHDNGQVVLDDPASDMGPVITDKDEAVKKYDAWDSVNW